MEESRKDFYKKTIIDMAEQLAGILDNGEAVEISRSRSGLKLIRARRRHEVIRKTRESLTGSR